MGYLIDRITYILVKIKLKEEKKQYDNFRVIKTIRMICRGTRHIWLKKERCKEDFGKEM